MSESGGDRHGAHELVPASAATHTAVQSGPWQAPETWDSGVPTDGAQAHVPEGTTVTVDHEDDASLDWLRVDGTLRFEPSTDTQLRVETVVTTGPSRFEMGTQSDPVDPAHTARLVIADRGPIDTEWDPERRSKGLITMGTVRLTGAEKTGWTTLASHAQAGDSSLELAESPTGWQPGDTLVLPGQTPPAVDDSGAIREDSVEDEEVTVRAVNGRRVELAQALQYDHVPPASGFDSYVLDLTRNVRIESENDTLDRRGHVMFMDRDVELRYAGTYDLGRTDKTRPFTNPTRLGVSVYANDGYGTDDIDDVLAEYRNRSPPNPKARYAIHFHMTGVDPATAPSHVEGCAIWGSPGWGLVNHSSHVEVRDSVSYEVVGAGFTTEAGNEIGTFERNFALRSTGSGENIRSRRKIQDFGHSGHGFWMQSPCVELVDNVAAGHRSQAFAYWTFKVLEPFMEDSDHLPFSRDSDGRPHIVPAENAAGQVHFDDSDRVVDGNVTPSAVRLTRCENNEAFASGGALLVGRNRWRHKSELRYVGEYPVIREFTAYGVGPHYLGNGNTGREAHETFGFGNVGLTLWQVDGLIVEEATLVGSGDDSGDGISTRTKTGSLFVTDSEIRGWNTGIVSPADGEFVVEQCSFDNSEFDVDMRVHPWAEQNGYRLNDNEFGDDGRVRYHFDLLSHYRYTKDVRPVGQVSARMDGRKLYANAQHLDYVPFPDYENLAGDRRNVGGEAGIADNTIPAGVRDNDEPVAYSDLVGLSNQEMYDQYGVSVQGELAPRDALDSPADGPEIVGGVIDRPASDGEDIWVDTAAFDIEEPLRIASSPHTIDDHYAHTSEPSAERESDRFPGLPRALGSRHNDPLTGPQRPNAHEGTFLTVAETVDQRRESPPSTADATTTIDVSGGTYYLWARVLPTEEGNGDYNPWSESDFYYRVDGGEWQTLWAAYSAADSGWTWTRHNEAETVNESTRRSGNDEMQWSGTPVELALDSGSHTLEIAYRSPQLRLDRLLLTSQDTLPNVFGDGYLRPNGADGLPPVVGERPPQDPDGDGLYRDVNGDGNVNILDVQALFNGIDSDAVQENASRFNFSGRSPDEVTILDVQALFNELSQ